MLRAGNPGERPPPPPPEAAVALTIDRVPWAPGSAGPWDQKRTQMQQGPRFVDGGDNLEGGLIG